MERDHKRVRLTASPDGRTLATPAGNIKVLAYAVDDNFLLLGFIYDDDGTVFHIVLKDERELLATKTTQQRIVIRPLDPTCGAD